MEHVYVAAKRKLVVLITEENTEKLRIIRKCLFFSVGKDCSITQNVLFVNDVLFNALEDVLLMWNKWVTWIF